MADGHPNTGTREAKVYGAVVLDAFPRRVVGWSIDSSQTANLVVNALGMAIENRQAEGGVIYSGQYTSWAFTRRAIDSGLVPSMGSIGDCYDNGQMGIVLGTHAGRAVEPEAVEHPPRAGQRHLRVPDLPQPATTPLVTLGMLSPIEYELGHAGDTARDQAG